jgi:hypothetical protein
MKKRLFFHKICYSARDIWRSLVAGLDPRSALINNDQKRFLLEFFMRMLFATLLAATLLPAAALAGDKWDDRPHGWRSFHSHGYDDYYDRDRWDYDRPRHYRSGRDCKRGRGHGRWHDDHIAYNDWVRIPVEPRYVYVPRPVYYYPAPLADVRIRID